MSCRNLTNGGSKMSAKKTSLVFVVAIFFAIFFFSAMPLTAKEITWEKIEDDSNAYWKKSYSLSVATGIECRIYTRQDNKGIKIEATDRGFNGNDVEQIIIISPNGTEGIIRTMHYNEDGSYFVHRTSAGYDVFQKKCLPYISELPPDICELFHGYAGIK